MYRNQKCQSDAESIAQKIRKHLNFERVDVVLIPGTGWGGIAEGLQQSRTISLIDVSGLGELQFLQAVSGHSFGATYGTLGTKTVLTIGRVHLYQDPYGDVRPNTARNLSRLLSEAALRLKPKAFIVTAGVGALPHERKTYNVGDVAVIRNFITVYAPKLPLFDGDDFKAPQFTISNRLAAIAENPTLPGPGCVQPNAVHVMVKGPNIETNLDKLKLAAEGGTVVGLSILPEVAVASLYEDSGTEVLALALVTNGWVEKHDHKKVKVTGEEETAVLEEYLTAIIAQV